MAEHPISRTDRSSSPQRHRWPGVDAVREICEVEKLRQQPSRWLCSPQRRAALKTPD